MSALDFSAATHEVQMAATTSLANLSSLSCWAWVNLRTYTGASGWRVFQKGYLARDGFVHYFGGGTTAVEFQYTRTTGVNYAATYGNFGAWGASKWLFIGFAHDSSSGVVKLYAGDLVSPPAEPSAYSIATPGSGSYSNDSAIALVYGCRGAGGGAFMDGIMHSSGWYPGVLQRTEFQQLWDLPPGLWRRAYRNAAGLWRFGANGRGPVFDESGNRNVGTISGATLVPNVLPRRRRAGASLALVPGLKTRREFLAVLAAMAADARLGMM